MKTKILLSVLALGVAFTSCKKDKDNAKPNGNSAELAFQLKAENRQSNVAQKTTDLPNVTWTAGVANPKVIKFSARQDNTEMELTTKNTGPIDLMTMTDLPFGNFTIPADTYDRVELKIILESDNQAPALFLAGNFTSGALTVPVEFEVEDQIEVKTEQKDVVITGGSLFTAITTFDLSSFVEGINEDMLLNARLTNGKLIISRESNRDLYKIIVKNLGDHRHHCEWKHKHK